MASGSAVRVAVGPLEMLFAGGDLRYLRVAGVEVLRRIYVGVRDERWGTVPGVLSDVTCAQDGSACRIRWRSEHRHGEVDFAWDGSADAEAQGEGQVRVAFRMDGRARSAFRTNRTGICVLHPIAHCAGSPCEIEHADGSVERGEFPRLIAPHQPFTGIRAMTHEPVAGVRVEVRSAGEVFETEDQRNWSDGSYKTYCRPLAMPYPYDLREGEQVVQTVTVTVTSRAGRVGQPRNTIRVGEDVGTLPAIGLQAAWRWLAAASGREMTLLREMRLSHLRVDMHCGGATDAGEAIAQVRAPACWLEVGLHLLDAPTTPAPERMLLAPLLGNDIHRVIVYCGRKPFATMEDVRLVEQTLFRPPATLVGGGTMGSFTELNRNRPPAGSMAVLAWPVNPQVHATDDLSLIENLQGQADTVRTARSFAPDARLAVGPIMLHRQPDPFADGKSGTERERIVGDARQRSQFGAAWTLVSIKRLAEAGADSLTYYEASGSYGVMDGGEVFPLYHVLKAAGQMMGARVLRCTSSDELAFDALAMRRAGYLRMIVACLRDEPVEVVVQGLPDGERTLRLGAYEVTMLDYREKERN